MLEIAKKTFAEAGSSQEAKQLADSTYWARDHRLRKKLGLQIRRVRISAPRKSRQTLPAPI
jgi:hypothetical protein